MRYVDCHGFRRARLLIGNLLGVDKTGISSCE